MARGQDIGLDPRGRDQAHNWGQVKDYPGPAWYKVWLTKPSVKWYPGDLVDGLESVYGLKSWGSHYTDTFTPPGQAQIFRDWKDAYKNQPRWCRNPKCWADILHMRPQAKYCSDKCRKAAFNFQTTLKRRLGKTSSTTGLDSSSYIYNPTTTVRKVSYLHKRDLNPDGFKPNPDGLEDPKSGRFEPDPDGFEKKEKIPLLEIDELLLDYDDDPSRSQP